LFLNTPVIFGWHSWTLNLVKIMTYHIWSVLKGTAQP